MAEDSFVHLHVHTQYSILDGAVRIKDAVKKAVEFGMPALAMTDHGNMFGAVEFYQAAVGAGVRPIIGCELYVAPHSRLEHKAHSARDAATHLTVLAADETGYHNLVKLVSEAHLSGFYYKPRVDKQLLAKHAKGLICMSGCLHSEVNEYLVSEQTDKARASVAEFRDIFGQENYFIELHNHGLAAQLKIMPQLVELAREFQLGLVAANDVHFLERAHHEAHDILVCIGTGMHVHDENRLRYSEELYFKSPSEMRALFAELPEACDNTLRIAERCQFEMEFGKSKYPAYPPPEGKSREAYLRELCYQGLNARYGSRMQEDTKILERLEYEMNVIERMGFVSYFLIVWDFINFARKQNIPVGPGRGSAAGSLVAYVLGITDVDPLRFDLIFERFLNPERISPPDIDIDFCVNRRGEVIDYVRRKYGERSVSHIVTFNTLGAKNTIRDVGRVLGWGYSEADRIARMIPNDLGITLNSFIDKKGETKLGAIDKNPDLKQAVETEEETARLWEYASLLEGLVRNTGVHAAGVVISDRDLSDYIPLCKGKEGEVVTQYAMNPLTDLGMLKMDFLGLKNLTVIEASVRLIRRKNPDFRIEEIPLDDQGTFDVINAGETIGVFQLESGGMASLCKRFDVQHINDIVALIALYRPGPMELIPDYIKRKKGQTRVKYDHPLLEEISSETYGILIYQEQVQKAANLLAGYSLGQADLLRRAMGKKDKEKMAKERERFIKGAGEVNGIPTEKASAIFDTLEKFANYGFNKSHSAAYAIISYRTAYLKANYPVEFMCGLLSNEINNTDKISVFVSECKRMGVTILPPDINRSQLDFAPEETIDGEAIRYGLAGIKNVGEGAMELVIEERRTGGEFSSIEDFCARLDSRAVNKKVIESLVKAGAFDFTGRDRAELFASIDSAIASAAASHRDRASGQQSLFDLMDESLDSTAQTTTLDYIPWTAEEKLAHEKDLLGFYVTGHPLDRFQKAFNHLNIMPISTLGRIKSENDQDPAEPPPDLRDARTETHIGGVLTAIEKRFGKKDNKPFAIVQIEDMTGTLEVAVWSDTYQRTARLLEVGAVVMISGKLSSRENSLRMTANDIKPIKPDGEGRPLTLIFPREKTTEADLAAVRQAVLRHPGQRPLRLEFHYANGRKAVVAADRRFAIDLTDDLKRDLAKWLVV